MVWTRDDDGSGGGGGSGSSDTDYDYSNRFFFQARTNERCCMTFAPASINWFYILYNTWYATNPFYILLLKKPHYFQVVCVPPKTGVPPPPPPPANALKNAANPFGVQG